MFSSEHSVFKISLNNKGDNSTNNDMGPIPFSIIKIINNHNPWPTPLQQKRKTSCSKVIPLMNLFSFICLLKLGDWNTLIQRCVRFVDCKYDSVYFILWILVTSSLAQTGFYSKVSLSIIFPLVIMYLLPRFQYAPHVQELYLTKTTKYLCNL